MLALVVLMQAHHPHDTVSALAASADGQTLLASCRSMLWQSSDGGENWRVVQPQDIRPFEGVGLTALAISPRDSRMALLYTGSHGSPHEFELWRSMDGGVTFRIADTLIPIARGPRPHGIFGPALHYVAVLGSTEVILLITIDQQLLRSTDSGETWLPTALSRISALLVLPRSVSAWPSHVVLAGSCDGTIYASHDAGASWAVAVGHSTGASPPPLLSPSPQPPPTPQLTSRPPSAPPLCHADAVSSLAKGLPDHCESNASSTPGTATILPLCALTVVEDAHPHTVSSAASRAVGCSCVLAHSLAQCLPWLLCAGSAVCEWTAHRADAMWRACVSCPG
jgi:hypothetical protein